MGRCCSSEVFLGRPAQLVIYQWRPVGKRCSTPTPHDPDQSRDGLFGRLPQRGDSVGTERQVKVRVAPTSKAIGESTDLAHEIYNRVLRRVPENMEQVKR